MDFQINLTYIIVFDGYTQLEKYRYLYFVLMCVVYVMILCCNFTIILIVVFHKNLHEPMYIFIAALLLNSVLFSSVIYPKLLIDFLSERQIITYAACLFQYCMFYSLCGSEVLLLLAMACDRYVSICKPLYYHTIMTNNTISTVLALAWLMPITHVSVMIVLTMFDKLCHFTLTGIFCNSSVKYLYCVRSTLIDGYAMLALFVIVLLPVVLIFLTYAKICAVAYQSGGDVKKKAAQTCLPHLLVLISFTCLCSLDVIIVGMGLDFPKTLRVVVSLQIVICQPLFNPIVYGLKMKEIYRKLERLFSIMKIF